MRQVRRVGVRGGGGWGIGDSVGVLVGFFGFHARRKKEEGWESGFVAGIYAHHCDVNKHKYLYPRLLGQLLTFFTLLASLKWLFYDT